MWVDGCDSIGTITGQLVTVEKFLECRVGVPLLGQPGERPIYAYDYDVLGIALGRACVNSRLLSLNIPLDSVRFTLLFWQEHSAASSRCHFHIRANTSLLLRSSIVL